MGRNHNKAGRGRKEATLYSESEEYDDTDTSGGETSAGNTAIHQTNPPMPQNMHQNIFSTSSNIHSGRDRTSSTTSSANVRMSHPPSGANGTPLPQVRQGGPLNNQQDPSKRQSGGRDGVVMGERSLLTNRITNFNNNPSSANGGMMNNNRHQAVNSALNNLNTTQFSNNTSSSQQGVGGANNLLAANSTDYRQHLNL